MPARQHGSVVRRRKAWAARYRDEHGVPRLRGGFGTKTAAREWLDTKVREIEALRSGDPAVLRRQDMPTLSELVGEYLAQHVCEHNTRQTLEARLRKATADFGDVRLDRLAVSELRAWRANLPTGSAWHIVKALRQVLGYAVAVGLLDSNPAKAIPNPEPKRTEIVPFATMSDVEAVAAELPARYCLVPVLGCLTGLRPSELLALERRDIDTNARLLHVRRVLVGGEVKSYGKTTKSLRVVPLAERALLALEAHPARIDSPLLLPSRSGAHIDLHNFRARHWDPAVRAAGLALCTCGHLSGSHERRCQECDCRRFKRAKGSPTPYAMRHTFASWAIAAPVPLFELSRLMGTSVEQLDVTYGHLLPDSAERTRSVLDAYLAASDQAASARAGSRP